MQTPLLQLLKPEAVLAGGILVAILMDLFTPAALKYRVAITGILACLGAILSIPHLAPGLESPAADHALFFSDGWSAFARVSILAATAMCLSVAPGTSALRGRAEAGEYYVLMMSLGLGALLFAGSGNLLSVYLSLEFMSLTSYALTGMRAKDAKASEAGLKYVLFGGMASALMLFGMSYLYGICGTLELGEIGEKLSRHQVPSFIVAPLALLGIGYAYKLALAPFHYWSPDVYEGSPTLSAAIFSVVPKIAGFIGLARALALLFPKADGVLPMHTLIWIICGVALLTMTAGNLSALAQQNAKRLLAYSSIAHAGYMLLVLGAGTSPVIILALGFYLTAYLFMNLGAFFAVSQLEDSFGSCELKDLAGARARHPWIALSLCICLFALMGLPPFSGFMAKWTILREVVRVGLEGPGHPALLLGAAGLMINSGIAAFAYLKIIRAVLLDKAQEPQSEPNYYSYRNGVAVVLACAGISLIMGIWRLIS